MPPIAYQRIVNHNYEFRIMNYELKELCTSRKRLSPMMERARKEN